ncbi:hypothetical protein BJV82DRAFT_674214 [Fennellomyces sp. T-0311]|nr:hypothetical protein BJV82DRAFT_674214 [Fennellomyces sp. T-0311]
MTQGPVAPSMREGLVHAGWVAHILVGDMGYNACLGVPKWHIAAATGFPVAPSSLRSRRLFRQAIEKKKAWPALLHVLRKVDKLSHKDAQYDDDEPAQEEALQGGPSARTNHHT